MSLDLDESLLEPVTSVRFRPDCVEVQGSDSKDRLQEYNWSCQSWTDPPNTNHPPHDHPYGHRVLCVSGWIEFTVAEKSYRLSTGDVLDLPERVKHSAVTSPEEPTTYFLLQPE
ncbi:MAG: cupin domain-containing protein [bacterium]